MFDPCKVVRLSFRTRWGAPLHGDPRLMSVIPIGMELGQAEEFPCKLVTEKRQVNPEFLTAQGKPSRSTTTYQVR